MNTLIETLQYFAIITFELIVLFIFITAIVEFILMHISEEKMRKKLGGKGVIGNIVAAAIGSLTPFCACSTIPMTIGFLNAKVPFGAVASFLIASPLLNPIIIGMLGALVGFKIAAIYFIIAFTLSVLFGYILEKTGASKLVKNVRVKGRGTINQYKKSIPFKQKVKISFKAGFDTLRPIMLYLLIGVALGAGIYGYMPENFVLKIAGPDNLFAVPIASIVGIPLYIRAETAIPIGLALMNKGMSIGAVISLIIGGAGMAIPEISLLSSIFKPKLVFAFVVVIFFTAVISGYVFNIIF